jgi:hypothetical protein
MKIRTGFVSNSSSSSFVVAVSKCNVCSHCGRGDEDVLDLIEQSVKANDDGETSIDSVDKVNVIKYIKESWYYDGRSKELISKIEGLDSNVKVAYINVSYHNEFLNRMLRNSKNVEILYSEG